MLGDGKKYIICWLVEANEEIPLIEFLLQLERQRHELLVTAIAHLKRAAEPANHGEPLTKALRGNMKGIFEIRAKTPQGYIRMPFVFAKEQRLIVLCGVIKKGRSLDSKAEKAIIRARDRLMNEEASYEESDFSSFN